MERTDLRHNTVLYSFWENTLSTSNNPPIPGEWDAQVYQLSKYGRGMPEALKFIHYHRPTFDTFSAWLEQTVLPAHSAYPSGYKLTPHELQFWDTNGYIIIKNVVSLQQCADARNAIWQHLDANPAEPETWYRYHDDKKGMMLDLFQHPALTAVRQSENIKQVYTQLYSNTDIFLLIDKVGFNPPETSNYKFAGSPLHWDVSLHLPIPFVLQGLVYLNDVSADEGAFNCVPGFHKEINKWMDSIPAGVNPRQAATELLKPIPVTGNTGDLLIWQQTLPHCATANKGKLPRMVQYVAYKPINTKAAEIWK